MSDAKRTTLGWLVDADALPKAAVKALLNLTLIANEALVRGGTLDIGAEEEDGRLEIVVRIAGPRIILDPELRRMLTEGEPADGVTSRLAAAFMIHSLVRDGGGQVQVFDQGDGVMVFGATFAART